MKYQKLAYVVLSAITLFGGSAAYATSQESVLAQAKKCTNITERLARLACFDKALKTPIYTQVNSNVPRNVPFSWQQAMDSFAETKPEEIAHLNLQGAGELSNAWLTVGASNPDSRFKEGKRPVLMMSCIDKISRLELALPSELSNGRVKVALVPGDSRLWRSDDSGYLLSAGRGMPAIGQMKRIMREKTITIRASDKTIDGLIFRTESLREDLKPLRERCDW